MTDNLPEQPNRQAPPRQMADAERQALLSHAIAMNVSRGGRVESLSAHQAVLVYGKQVNHVLHLILSLVTCGAWAFVWLILALTVKEKRSVLMVDPYGHIVHS